MLLPDQNMNSPIHVKDIYQTRNNNFKKYDKMYQNSSSKNY